MGANEDQKISSSNSSRRSFLKVGAGVLAGAAVAAATISQLPLASAGESPAQISSTSSVTAPQSVSSSASSSTQSQSTANPQIQIDTITGFLALNQTEQPLLTALAQAIIPSDSNGPGATEAGVVYFIDRQLATDYGKSGNMYMQGPFVLGGVNTPLTVDGIYYPEGSLGPPAGGGYSYQYALNLREFWRVGLEALESYSNSAYGGNFETLGATTQAQVLADLWSNKPTSFSQIKPSDFAWELTFMVWSGFLTDPLYGGNRNMVGWQYVAFNGVNMGNFYGEGHTPQELMVATTPTRLQPASLAQFQKGSP